MGTRAHLEFWYDDQLAHTRSTEQHIADIVNEMKRLDSAMSPYIESSELSLVNRQAGKQEVVITEELFSLLQVAQKLSKLSKGAFDITYASLGYRYDYRNKIRPDSQVISESLASINYQSIQLDSTKLTVKFTNPNVKIDLGGIAKGYAIKRCIDLLKNKGIEHALMSAGGDTLLLGDRRGRPWMVGIKHPREDDKNVVHLPLNDEAISTSGDYERFFIEDGIRYHHIINPKTGDSAREVVSVSVIGSDATIVDALSTTAFVKGLGDGMKLINSLKGYEAIIIDNKHRLHFSNGLQQ